MTAAGAALADLDATVTLTFAAGQNIADEAANALADTAPTGSDDNTFVLDNTAPTFVSGTANGVTLVLTFSEELDPSSEPPGGAFDVSAIATNPAVGSVALDGATVTLTVAPAVIAYQTVTVANNAHGWEQAFRRSGTPPATRWRRPVDAGNYSLTNETPLGPPASLTAEAGDGRVRLVWTDPEGISPDTGYQVRHAASASVPSGTAWTSLTGEVLTVLVSGLANGTAHAFEVRAVHSGEMGAAATVSATSATAVCSAPGLGGRREVWSDTLTVGRSFVDGQAGDYGQGSTDAGYEQNSLGSLAGGASQFSVGAARYNISENLHQRQS